MDLCSSWTLCFGPVNDMKASRIPLGLLKFADAESQDRPTVKLLSVTFVNLKEIGTWAAPDYSSQDSWGDTLAASCLPIQVGGVCNDDAQRFLVKGQYFIAVPRLGRKRRGAGLIAGAAINVNMISLNASFSSALVLGLVYYIYTKVRNNGPYSHLPLPPGPKRLPLIGNILDLPRKFEWETYHKWCAELNTDILYLNFAGTNVVVLDTYEAAYDLLEKRSSIYSGRPQQTMANELMGWEFSPGFMPYGEKWCVFEQYYRPARVQWGV
ncbi:unnamed protein product [Cyclocybe aegerita]|uniref:Cytochrome P450 n=1 Tax=Cyclocybe aegerita TaxID=1973307 RepID=A0A8S0W3M8_CYCAE|nr:unnamed protein product [Cyclocybe aegerita]